MAFSAERKGPKTWPWGKTLSAIDAGPGGASGACAFFRRRPPWRLAWRVGRFSLRHGRRAASAWRALIIGPATAGLERGRWRVNRLGRAFPPLSTHRGGWAPFIPVGIKNQMTPRATEAGIPRYHGAKWSGAPGRPDGGQRPRALAWLHLLRRAPRSEWSPGRGVVKQNGLRAGVGPRLPSQEFGRTARRPPHPEAWRARGGRSCSALNNLPGDPNWDWEHNPYAQTGGGWLSKARAAAARVLPPTRAARARRPTGEACCATRSRRALGREPRPLWGVWELWKRGSTPASSSTTTTWCGPTGHREMAGGLIARLDAQPTTTRSPPTTLQPRRAPALRPAPMRCRRSPFTKLHKPNCPSWPRPFVGRDGASGGLAPGSAEAQSRVAIGRVRAWHVESRFLARGRIRYGPCTCTDESVGGGVYAARFGGGNGLVVGTGYVEARRGLWTALHARGLVLVAFSRAAKGRIAGARPRARRQRSAGDLPRPALAIGRARPPVGLGDAATPGGEVTHAIPQGACFDAIRQLPAFPRGGPGAARAADSSPRTAAPPARLGAGGWADRTHSIPIRRRLAAAAPPPPADRDGNWTIPLPGVSPRDRGFKANGARRPPRRAPGPPGARTPPTWHDESWGCEILLKYGWPRPLRFPSPFPRQDSHSHAPAPPLHAPKYTWGIAIAVAAGGTAPGVKPGWGAILVASTEPHIATGYNGHAGPGLAGTADRRRLRACAKPGRCYSRASGLRFCASAGPPPRQNGCSRPRASAFAVSGATLLHHPRALLWACTKELCGRPQCSKVSLTHDWKPTGRPKTWASRMVRGAACRRAFTGGCTAVAGRGPRQGLGAVGVGQVKLARSRPAASAFPALQRAHCSNLAGTVPIHRRR